MLVFEADAWWLHSHPIGHRVAFALLAVMAVAWASSSRRSVGRADLHSGWIPTVVVTLALLAGIFAVAALVDPRGPIEFGESGWRPARWITHRLVVAAAQQLMLQLVLWPLCQEILEGRRPATALAALIFGLLHLPSPWLVALSGGGALAWLLLYQNGSGLVPLVISHFILSVGVQTAFDDQVHYGMRIGASAAAYQSDSSR